MQSRMARDAADPRPSEGAALESGLRAFKECRWPEAIAGLRQVVAAKPGHIDVTSKLAFALSQAKRYDEAITVLTGLCSLEPRSPKWPYMVGYQFYVQSDWKRAIEWFDRALDLNANYVKALYRKAYSHSKLGQEDLCIRAVERCIQAWRRLSPELQAQDKAIYGKVNFLLGKTYLGRGLSLKARRPLQTAVETKSDDPDYLYELGKCLLTNRDMDGAIRELERANTLRPGTDYVLDRLAQAYMGKEDDQKALDLYLQIPAQRRKPYVLTNLGKAYLQLGRPDAAIETLQAASRKDRSNHNTQYWLGRGLEAVGDPRAALQAYREAVQLRDKRYHKDFPEAREAAGRLEAAVPQPNEATEPAAAPGERTGVISGYNTARGFGFIQSDGERIFFHVTGLCNDFNPAEGISVAFRVEASDRGPRAVQVRPMLGAGADARRQEAVP